MIVRGGYSFHQTSQARARLESLRDRRVGIVGLGREGLDLAQCLVHWAREIVVSDRNGPDALAAPVAALDGLPVSYRLGSQQPDALVDCDEVFVSPGVPPEAPVVAGAARAGIPISSATSLFFDLCPGPIIGITGSSGKTTTTSLVAAMLRAGKLPMVVGGNIGIPMLGRLGEITPQTWTVLELSSFQLSDLTRSPQIGAVLNITPNHLDRHPDMADYTRAKGNVLRYQAPSDTAVVNADDPITLSLPHVSATLQFSLCQAVNGSWLEDGALWRSGEHAPFLHVSDLNLRGSHNIANVLAAATLAGAAGCASSAMATAVRAFRPVAHRLEMVGAVEGIRYVNDSIATSPERSMAAIRSFDEPIVLIAGGRDKHVPMEDWARLISQRVKAIVLVGEAAPLIRDALLRARATPPVLTAPAFRDTLELARSIAQDGDIVLLSPGCTSFDEFHDYEERGITFRDLVRQLDGFREAEE